MSESPAGLERRFVVRIAVILEASLVLLAFSWCVLRGASLPIHPDWRGAVAGVIATIPMLLVNLGVFGKLGRDDSPQHVFFRFKSRFVIPLVRHLTVPTAAVIALASGFAEEVFFRGALLEELRLQLTLYPAVILSSLVFSYMHFISMLREFWPVMALYFLFGLYFSYLVIASGDLTTAIIAHALYNFAAIVYLRYWEVPKLPKAVKA